MRPRTLRLAGFCVLILLAGCKQDPTTNATLSPQEQAAADAAAGAAPGATPSATPTPQPRPSGPVEFTDVTAEAGIRFRHNSGAAGKKYLPETMGSGAAFLDYDNDGWQDILLVNSTGWPGERGAQTTSALYRNNQDGTFRDVTREAGLAQVIYGIGCAVGDYDNDGFADIFITAVGPD
ncbi:MAG TPA: VCBS repeat-containing protein, partial [Pyrinomonadaceae bacterium]|nr:VCBS repeat-containing protein [Pyrinomonadaceae bacterium]